MTKINLLKLLKITLVLIAIPLVAMLFTDEVYWKPIDFFVMGIMIFTTIITGLIINKKLKTRTKKVLVVILLITLFLLIWAQLGVGIFSTFFSTR